jgi:hypothetical protein
VSAAGIWRHYAPDIEDVDVYGEEGVEHGISKTQDILHLY